MRFCAYVTGPVRGFGALFKCKARAKRRLQAAVASLFAASRPALLLAACQLIDTLLAVLPDDFSALSWMFVPSTSRFDAEDALSVERPPSSAPSQAAGPEAATPPPACAPISSASWGQPNGFAALLAPLCCLEGVYDSQSSSRSSGLLLPSACGRRRPLLGMRTLRDARELSPFARHLARHLARSALHSRAAELDVSRRPKPQAPSKTVTKLPGLSFKPIPTHLPHNPPRSHVAFLLPSTPSLQPRAIHRNA